MPRQVDPEIRKAEIAAAALEICRTEGLSALTFRRLATQMGVQSTTVIRHYAKTRSELLAIMLGTFLQQISALAEGVLFNLPPADALKMLLENVVPMYPSVRAIARMGLDAALEINRTGGQLGEGLSDWGTWLETTIGSLVSQCNSPLGADAATNLVVTTLTGLSLYTVIDGDRWPPERQRTVIDTLLQVVLPPTPL